MPAIQPARLKQQTARLCSFHDQPEIFVRELHRLLRQYSELTQRAGQAGVPPSLMDSYHVPSPVLRQIMIDLKPLVGQAPEASLALSEALWKEPYYEFRLLAANLLGQIPVSPSTTIMGTIRNWLSEELDNRLIQAVIQHGMARLRRDSPQSLLDLAQDWLAEDQIYPKRCCLITLQSLLTEKSFENIPFIFRIITPLLRAVPSDLKADLVILLHALALESPQETAFILRKNLETSDHPDTPWLIRQVIADLPPTYQENLRQAMKSAA